VSGEVRRSVADLRRSYGSSQLDESDLAADPMTQFAGWLDAIVEADSGIEANAMVLSTVGADARPSSRMVLLKSADERGFVFYTNYGSLKAVEIAANPAVSLQFPWVALERQVVVTGEAERVSRTETAAYFRTRPYASQLGAWASPQSSVVADRAELDQAYAKAAALFPEGREVPVPDHWGGFLVRPQTVEFWQGRTGRLHDRLRYRRDQQGAWVVERLAP
jgi:pyridoxamine 5'-phosphate oxidase